MSHWLACLWGYVGSRESDYPWNTPWYSYDSAQSWRQKAGISASAHASELYVVSLYVALNNIFGGGCEISPASYPEFACQAFMIFVGSSVWAYVIGSASGLKATADPITIAHNQRMDELNLFCAEQRVPIDLQVRLREYFRSSLSYMRSTSYDRLLERMPTRLRGDTVLRACEYRMREVPFLIHPKIEPEFMSHLASRFKRGVYARLDRIACVELFILDRGVAAKHGRLGLTGACFGRDVILSNEALRDESDAIALTFVQTTRLSRTDILDLLPPYPQAGVVVRRAALRMALTRALVMAARIAQRPRSRSHMKSVTHAVLRGAEQFGLTEIFDLALLEAEQVSYPMCPQPPLSLPAASPQSPRSLLTAHTPPTPLAHVCSPPRACPPLLITHVHPPPAQARAFRLGVEGGGKASASPQKGGGTLSYLPLTTKEKGLASSVLRRVRVDSGSGGAARWTWAKRQQVAAEEMVHPALLKEECGT